MELVRKNVNKHPQLNWTRRFTAINVRPCNYVFYFLGTLFESSKQTDLNGIHICVCVRKWIGQQSNMCVANDVKNINVIRIAYSVCYGSNAWNVIWLLLNWYHFSSFNFGASPNATMNELQNCLFAVTKWEYTQYLMDMRWELSDLNFLVYVIVSRKTASRDSLPLSLIMMINEAYHRYI